MTLRILLTTDVWQIVNALFLMEYPVIPESAFCIKVRENVYHVCQFIEAQMIFYRIFCVQK